MSRTTSVGATLLLAASAMLALVGCGRSTEDLCEDFVDECGDDRDSVRSCVRRADELEQRATEAGCLEPYDAYLDCVDGLESLCDTADDCAAPREDLARCGVFFE
ncbi:MAG: hypothetical protein JNL21_27040 [Myxococcales bacterium]|nr:hypothetical protein [Myxococcales bacterium]